jgi:hypothetical protein
MGRAPGLDEHLRSDDHPLNTEPSMTHFAPAAIAGPTIHRQPVRTRMLAAAAALCLAIPGTVFVIDAISGDAPAPVQVAKKGSFDITE